MGVYFDFEVSLARIDPRIWRRFLLERDATFLDLHWAIQDAGGWENCHLFSFRASPRARDEIAGEGRSDFGPPARRVPLSAHFAKRGDRCVYVYDFGDGWEHRVRLRGVTELPETFHRRLLDGARAFPLEDSGGVYGYYGCLAAVGRIDPADLDIDPSWLEEKAEWLPPDWDPEAFDLEAARQDFDLQKRPKRLSESDLWDAGTADDDFLDPWDDWMPDADALLDGWGDEQDLGVGDLLELLGVSIRVPEGYAVPVPMPPPARRLVLEQPDLDGAVARAIREAAPEAPSVLLTLDETEVLMDALAERARRCIDPKTRAALNAVRQPLEWYAELYVEAEVDEIGLPSESPGPLEPLALDLENSLLYEAGIIDANELAARTGKQVAGPDHPTDLRLTGPQREAVLEAADLPDSLRSRLAIDSRRTETIRLTLAEVAELEDLLAAAVAQTTGNLKAKLQRAQYRAVQVLSRYVPAEDGPPPAEPDTSR